MEIMYFQYSAFLFFYSDEFLAFFDSSGARPKTQNKVPSIRKPLLGHSVSKLLASVANCLALLALSYIYT